VLDAGHKGARRLAVANESDRVDVASDSWHLRVNGEDETVTNMDPEHRIVRARWSRATRPECPHIKVLRAISAEDRVHLHPEVGCRSTDAVEIVVEAFSDLYHVDVTRGLNAGLEGWPWRQFSAFCCDRHWHHSQRGEYD
jgi:hypothetical protein